MPRNILLVAALALIIFGVIGIGKAIVSEPLSLPEGVEDELNEVVDGTNTTTPREKQDEGQGDEHDAATTTDVTLATPQPRELVTSPLVIAGKARGPWYFEASFSARLTDNQGRELGTVVLQAQDEPARPDGSGHSGGWMTTDFVPFVGTMRFEAPTTSAGTLILEKANPSGLPEHGDEVHIPVRFSADSQ